MEPTVVENAIGLDVFIGEHKWIGKGLSPKIIESFLNAVIWPHFQFCVVDPDERNFQSIPNSVMNLDLDLRESSRGSSILSRPILTIWGDLRSTIPGALARSKFQVADRVGYIRMFEKCGFERHKIIHSKDAMEKPVKLLLMLKSKDK